MATTQQIRQPNQQTGTWSNVFPNEQVTQQQSSLFVKKLLAVSVSNITYLRAIFPEYAFGDRCLEDLNLKILRDDSSCPGACQVIKWIKGCFDALEKKYLRMLILGLFADPEDPETVIESYTFKFSYHENNTAVDVYRNEKKISTSVTAAETKKATIQMLRTIIVLTQTLTALPDNVLMTMKLLYYDEVTPPDYQPPGFKEADAGTFKFDDDPMNVKIGDISTPFHTVKLRIKTPRNQFEMQEEPIAEESDDLEISEGLDKDDEAQIELQSYENYEETESDAKELDNMKAPKQCEDVPNETPAKPGNKNDEAASPLESQTTPSNMETTEDEFGVRCPCSCNEDDGLMILCAACKYWQHAVCFSILDENEAPSRHICESCADLKDPEKQPTDPSLCHLNDIVTEATCLWRRALNATLDMPRILAPSLSRRLGVEMTVAQGLVNRLEKEGFVSMSSKGKRLGKLVNKKKVTDVGFKKYLKRKTNNEYKTTELESDLEIPKKGGTKTIEEPVNDLAEHARSLSLHERKAKKMATERITEADEVSHSPSLKAKQHSINGNSSKSNRGRKRTISAINEAYEFELSDSQEFDDRPNKYGRGSIAVKHIKV